MRRSRDSLIAAALLLATAAWPLATRAQEPAKPAPLTKADEAKPLEAKTKATTPTAKLDRRTRAILDTLATAGQMPDELKDPAFDRYADLTLLGSAWADLDASLMTDVALQILEGERVLMRSHRVINSEELLKVATRLAGVKKDSLALSRLEQAIKPRGNATLLAQCNEARSAIAAPSDPMSTVSVEALSTEAFALYKGCLQDLDAALVAGDPAAVKAIEEELAAMTILPDEYRVRIKSKAAQSKIALASHEEPIAQVANILDKLAGATRNPGAWLDNPTIPEGPNGEEPPDGETPPDGGTPPDGFQPPNGRVIPPWTWRPRPHPPQQQQQQQQQWIPPQPPGGKYPGKTPGKTPPPPPPSGKFGGGGYYPGQGYPRRYSYSW